MVLYGGTRASTCFFPTLFIAAVVTDHNNDGQKREIAQSLMVVPKIPRVHCFTKTNVFMVRTINRNEVLDKIGQFCESFNHIARIY